jgi:sulfur-carrier protein
LTPVQIVYFASVREAIGIDGEAAELPNGIVTIADCLQHLILRSEAHRAAFSDISKLRFALDQVMARIDAPISGAKELAIFPPVTGG